MCLIRLDDQQKCVPGNSRTVPQTRVHLSTTTEPPKDITENLRASAAPIHHLHHPIAPTTMRPATRHLVKFLEPGAPTGLAGLLTHPAPRSTLIYLYSSTLSKLAQLPAQSPYRQATEALTKKRLEAIEALKPEGFDAWYDRTRAQIEAHREKFGSDAALTYGGRSFVLARIFEPQVDEREKAAEWDGEPEGRPTEEGPRSQQVRDEEMAEALAESAASRDELPAVDPEPSLTKEQYESTTGCS